jgi:arylsulfatase A-like enzyme
MAKKPNLIIVLLDQFRADKVERLPILDEIKKEGVYFPEMITYAPYTLASVHALLTGIYGNNNGVDAYFNGPNYDKNNCYTLAQHLSDYGFHCQLDTYSKICFPSQGFNYVEEYSEDNDDVISRHLDVLQQVTKKNKYFLFLHYGGIHKPIIDNIVKKHDYDDDKYYSNIAENTKVYDKLIDKTGDYIESLWSYLKENVLDDTIVLFFSDHGGSVGEKWGELCYGVYTYDYTIKTWAIMAGAQTLLPKGTTFTSMIRSVDIVPSILDMYRIKAVPFCKNMNGESILSTNTSRIAFSETAGLSGPHPSPYKPNIHCVRTAQWKLIWNTTTNMKELYDLNSDPYEINNLIGQGISIENSLNRELLKHVKA